MNKLALLAALVLGTIFATTADAQLFGRRYFAPRYLPILPAAPVAVIPIAPSPGAIILPVKPVVPDAGSKYFYGGHAYQNYSDALAARSAVQQMYLSTPYIYPRYRW